MPMENQLWFHRYMMIVYIILLFTMKFVHGGSGPNTIVSLPCSQRYLSESYFEKHDSLLDLDFQGFLAHELAVCLSNSLPHNLSFVPRISVLQRHLVGEGSHRHLSTFVKFNIQPQGTYELHTHSCQALVVERLPSGVFADPFELQHIVQRGVFLVAAVFGDTNLELPSALSNRSVAEVHMDIGQNILSGNKKELEINLDLPLHARYPPLGRSSYSRVEMGVPDILICCTTKEKSQHNSCTWMTVAEFNTNAVVWIIPAGNKAHSQVVSAVTFIAALLSTLLIALSAIYSPNVHFTNNSKQL